MATEVYGRIGDTDWQTIIERDVNWLCISSEGQCGHAHDEQHSVLNQFHISPYLKTGKRQDTMKTTMFLQGQMKREPPSSNSKHQF